MVAQAQVAPRLLDLTVRSPALGTEAKVRLLTPAGWRRGSRDTDITRLKALERVLVVMPDGSKRARVGLAGVRPPERGVRPQGSCLRGA